MTTKLLLAALVLAASPSWALATCFGDHGKEQVTMSCPEGQTLDTDTKTCITPSG